MIDLYYTSRSTYQHTVSQYNGAVQLKSFVEEGYSVLPDCCVGKGSLVESAQRFIIATGKAIACQIFAENLCHFCEGVCGGGACTHRILCACVRISPTLQCHDSVKNNSSALF